MNENRLRVLPFLGGPLEGRRRVIGLPPEIVVPMPERATVAASTPTPASENVRTGRYRLTKTIDHQLIIGTSYVWEFHEAPTAVVKGKIVASVYVDPRLPPIHVPDVGWVCHPNKLEELREQGRITGS